MYANLRDVDHSIAANSFLANPNDQPKIQGDLRRLDLLTAQISTHLVSHYQDSPTTTFWATNECLGLISYQRKITDFAGKRSGQLFAIRDFCKFQAEKYQVLSRLLRRMIEKDCLKCLPSQPRSPQPFWSRHWIKTLILSSKEIAQIPYKWLRQSIISFQMQIST